jgi:hypothetical protein
MANKFTAEQIAEVIKLSRNDSLTRQQIKEKTGVSIPAIGYYITKDRTGFYPKQNQRKMKIKINKDAPKKVYAKKQVVEEPVRAARPMIALVGTPHEITQSIRELFS